MNLTKEQITEERQKLLRWITDEVIKKEDTQINKYYDCECIYQISQKMIYMFDIIGLENPNADINVRCIDCKFMYVCSLKKDLILVLYHVNTIQKLMDFVNKENLCSEIHILHSQNEQLNESNLDLIEKKCHGCQFRNDCGITLCLSAIKRHLKEIKDLLNKNDNLFLTKDGACDCERYLYFGSSGPL